MPLGTPNYEKAREGRRRPDRANFHAPKDRHTFWWHKATNSDTKARGESMFQHKPAKAKVPVPATNGQGHGRPNPWGKVTASEIRGSDMRPPESGICKDQGRRM